MDRENIPSFDGEEHSHFYNHDTSTVHNQVARQTHIGDAYHGPVYIYNGPRDKEARDPSRQTTVLDHTNKVREKCLESLEYSLMDNREMSIKNAYAQTCQWLLEKSEYTDWTDDTKLKEHCGILWIKGKPGTGKSTIVKFVFSGQPFANSVAFYFNARGDELDKSTMGMYRSLLVQIFQKIPRLQSILDLTRPKPNENGHIVWTLEILKHVLREVVNNLKDEKLTCFIDALDECDEEEVRDMVGFFEELGKIAMKLNVLFRTCFSSRHYPNITIVSGISLVLEDQEGHYQDLEIYLSSQLRIGNSKLASEIREEILERASGIFLWMVLVTQILNKEYDHGRMHALRRRMDKIPNDLEALFNDILTREGSPSLEVVICLQCVLYAQRPLRVEELYFAILAAADSEEIEAWDPNEITEQDITRFVISTSKGLVEIIKVTQGQSRRNVGPSRPLEVNRVRQSTVQFIHESVRDFLRGRGLRHKYFAPEDTFAARSHDLLRRCCHTYYEKASLSDRLRSHVSIFKEGSKVTNSLYGKDTMDAFPFLEYAIDNVLYHSDIAQELGLSQEHFIKNLSFIKLVEIRDSFVRERMGQHRGKITMLYILAEEDLPHLLELELNRICPTEMSLQERLFSPLFVAMVTKSARALYVLFDALISFPSQKDYGTYEIAFKADVYDAVSVVLNLKPSLNLAAPSVITKLDALLALLKIATGEDLIEALKIILKVAINGVPPRFMVYGEAVEEAVIKGYTKIVARLLEAHVQTFGRGVHLVGAFNTAKAGGNAEMISLISNVHQGLILKM